MIAYIILSVGILLMLASIIGCAIGYDIAVLTLYISMFIIFIGILIYRYGKRKSEILNMNN